MGRYAHARQSKRMRKSLKKQKGYKGRTMQELLRHIQDILSGPLRDWIISKLALVSPLLHQPQSGSGKIYALRESEVDCISKGKALVRYKLGTKVSTGTSINEGFVVDMRALPGNPYDGHTLAEALE